MTALFEARIARDEHLVANQMFRAARSFLVFACAYRFSIGFQCIGIPTAVLPVEAAVFKNQSPEFVR